MSDPNVYQPGGGRGNDFAPYNQGQMNQQQADLAAQRNEFLNYRFSPDELRVIRECEIESFYNRSLPFGLGLGTSAFLAVKNGYLKGNAKFGPWPKVIFASIFGYIAGRISYTNKCQEKLMALPNSRFAEMLRRRRQQGRNWDMGTQDAGAATALSLAPFQATTDSYTDEYNKPSSLNLDTNRPHYSTLDEYSPTMEGSNDLNEDLAIPTRKNTVTYDELRQKNRDEYAKNHYSPYNQRLAPPAQQPPPPVGADPGLASPPPYNPTPGPFNAPSEIDRRRANLRARNGDENAQYSSGPKNKYGDTWSE